MPHRAQVSIVSNLEAFAYLLTLFALFFPKKLSDASVVSESFSRSMSSTSSSIDVYRASLVAICIGKKECAGLRFEKCEESSGKSAH